VRPIKSREIEKHRIALLMKHPEAENASVPRIPTSSVPRKIMING
jgi:hypothetical protein